MRAVSGTTIGVERPIIFVQSFDRREHRHRRRDQRIAVEQRSTDDAQHRNPNGALAQGALRQGHQGERTALPVVVRPQQDDDVFQGDDDDQRPQDQRQDAEDHRRCRRSARPHRGGDGDPEGIERTGPDIPINDADAAEDQPPKAAPRMRRDCPVGGQIRCSGSRNSVGHLFDHYAALQHDWGGAYSTCQLTRQVADNRKTRSSHASHGVYLPGRREVRSREPECRGYRPVQTRVGPRSGRNSNRISSKSNALGRQVKRLQEAIRAGSPSESGALRASM